MLKISEIASNLTYSFSRFIRALLLILWIIGLSYVALGSLTGSLAKFLLATGDASSYINIGAGRILFSKLRIGISVPQEDQKCPTADQLLSEYRFYESNCPPIDSLLDVVLPNWNFAKTKTVKSENCSAAETQGIRQTYLYLFSKVAGRLKSIARNENLDPKMVIVDTSFLSPEFQQNNTIYDKSADLKLPVEIQDWITRERQRLKKESQALSLVGTFLLLGVLGAFGALIFLIRDFISPTKETNLCDYIFRPVLGIFLAVAIFVIDVLAHSVISTASILEIRYEPLYLLALGAGLLSERVYDVVRHRADSAIERYDRSEEEVKEEKLNSTISVDT